MSKMRRIFAGGDNGFTLIELLVVIAVLGILAAIAIPRLSGVTDKARLSEAVSALGSLRTAQELYATENEGNYATTTGDLFDYVDEESLNLDDWTFTSEGDEDDYDLRMEDGDLQAQVTPGMNKVATDQDNGLF